MTKLNPELQNLKRRNLKEMLESEYQMKFNSNNLAICPFHDDHKPSFNVFEGKDGFWRWNCFGCSKQGDYFDFRALKEGGSLEDVLKSFSTKAPNLLSSGGYPGTTLKALRYSKKRSFLSRHLRCATRTKMGQWKISPKTTKWKKKLSLKVIIAAHVLMVIAVWVTVLIALELVAHFKG